MGPSKTAHSIGSFTAPLLPGADMHSHAGADISPVSADVPTKSFPSSLPCTTMLAGVAANIVGDVLLPKCFGI